MWERSSLTFHSIDTEKYVMHVHVVKYSAQVLVNLWLYRDNKVCERGPR